MIIIIIIMIIMIIMIIIIIDDLIDWSDVSRAGMGIHKNLKLNYPKLNQKNGMKM